MWKAVIQSVQDVGNGTGDVHVEFRNGDVVVRQKSYNFTAGQVTLESAREVVLTDLRALATFDKLIQKAQSLIGHEVILSDDDVATL